MVDKNLSMLLQKIPANIYKKFCEFAKEKGMKKYKLVEFALVEFLEKHKTK